MVSIMEPDQGGYGEPWVWASAVWEREKGLPGDSLFRHPVETSELVCCSRGDWVARRGSALFPYGASSRSMRDNSSVLLTCSRPPTAM